MHAAMTTALARLDAIAERDNQPRLFVYPQDADGYWLFTDTHVLFRFMHDVPPVDLGRWLRVQPAKGHGGVLAGADRHAHRSGRSGKAWHLLVPGLAHDASRWGEDGLDIVTFYPNCGCRETYPQLRPEVTSHGLGCAWCANAGAAAIPGVSINARLFRLALMPARTDEIVLCDTCGSEPVWFHGRDWSAAVAPLRHVGRVRSARTIVQID